MSAAAPGPRIALEPFDSDRDRELIARWLGHPHVARWWGDADRALSELATRDTGTVALIVLEGRPVGLLCWQVPSRAELSEAGLDDLPTDLVDVDIMIGEPVALGRGIGPAALQLQFDQLRNRGVQVVGLATAQANTRALRACHKVGLQPYRDFVEDGEAHRYLVKNLDEQ